MNDSNSKLSAAAETTLGQDVLALLRHWLRGRRGWLILGSAAAAGGLWLGWPSLAAAGLAPLILGVLPCLAMCAVGLCMRGGRRSCESKAGNAPNDLSASAPSAPRTRSGKRQETKQ